jgi:transposase
MGERDSIQIRRHRRQLEKILKADRSRCRRVLAALAFIDGKKVADIVDFLKVSRQVVYKWLKMPIGDLIGNETDNCRGRPSKWTVQIDELLEQALKHFPHQLGMPATNWTIPLLCSYVFKNTGEIFSEATLRRRLHADDFQWKRPRIRLKPDPKKEKKRGEFDFSSENCPQEA